MSKNPPNSNLQGWFGGLGQPLWVKMAQDASWIASGAEFGDLLELNLSPRWPKLGQNGAKMALCWSTWSPRWSTWQHFGRHLEHVRAVFGAIFRKSGRSVKNGNTIRFLARFCFLGGSSWRLLGNILGDLGRKLGSLGRSWRQVGNFLATCWD